MNSVFATQRFRYTTSVLYCVALGLEYLTPLVPQAFLPLASVANVGKSIGLATYVATQGQQMVMDNAGLAAAVLLLHAVRGSEQARRMLPLVVFPFLVVGDLVSIYYELQSIQLRSLNRQRAEILAAEWLSTGTVPTPSQVSKRERQFLPAVIDCGPLPLRMGSLDKCVRSQEALEKLLSPDGRRLKYVLSMSQPCDPKGLGAPVRGLQALGAVLGLRRRARGQIAVAFRSDAGSNDALQAVLQAAQLRADAAKPDGSDVTTAGKAAAASLRPFLSSLEAAGWHTDTFLLNRREKATYTLA